MAKTMRQIVMHAAMQCIGDTNNVKPDGLSGKQLICMQMLMQLMGYGRMSPEGRETAKRFSRKRTKDVTEPSAGSTKKQFLSEMLEGLEVEGSSE